MAVTEKEIQLHIWGLKDKWVELISPVIFPEPEYFLEDENNILTLTPDAAMLNQVYARLADLDKYIRESSLIGCEVHLKKDEESTIRADLLCSSAGKAGFGIIEIIVVR
jgi:hypothetical protein